MGDVISARLLLSVIGTLAVTGLIFLLPGGYTPAIKAVFWIGAVAIIFQGIFTSTNAWFQYREKYWLSAWATIFGAALSAALTYWYTIRSPSLGNLLFANTAGYIVTAGLGGILHARSPHLPPHHTEYCTF